MIPPRGSALRLLVKPKNPPKQMASWLENARTFLALALVAATLVPFWRHDAWWVRACEFPRVQLLVTGLTITMTYLFLAPRLATVAVVALLLASSAYQTFRIFPYTPLAKPQVTDAARGSTGARVSILVANVLMSNRQADKLVAQIRDVSPDLVLTVETDAFWEKRLRTLESEYPHTVKQPLENTYGMLLQSRFELIDPEVRYLVEEDVPSIHAVVQLANGDRIELHLLHPKPPYPAESLETTGRDGELLMVGREVGGQDRPTIVAGDLNDVAWSYTTRLLQRISGLLDPRIGRGLLSTYHAQIPLLRWPLDHVFHSHHFRLVRLERLPAFGSDHFPVFVELDLDPVAPYIQEEPSPDREDLELVEEKIEEADPLESVPSRDTLEA